MTTILISAGDLSGERCAADLVRAIRANRPDTRFVGMGGAAMAAAGVELVVDQRELAVGGIVETFGSLGRVVRAWHRMSHCVRSCQPDLVVLVDSGGFNLPFARRVRSLGRAQILYYVAPQIWAWRPHRARLLAERADRIAVILAFEPSFYRGHGIDVDFVGHPLLDREPDAEGEGDPAATRRRAARRRQGLDESAPLLGLFPGSRRSELAAHLALQIETFRILRRQRSDLQAVIGLAPSLEGEDFERRLAKTAGDAIDAIRIVHGDSSDALDAVDVALTKPGTITLELLLRRCPMVVAGRVNGLTARIVRRSIQVPYLALPNLLSGEEIVPERIQEDARPDRIAAALAPLFEGPERERQRAAFEGVRERLGTPGASLRTARIVEEMLGHPSA